MLVTTTVSDLLDTIKADMLTARKERNSEAVKVYTTLYGELELISKKNGTAITDELVVSTVKKFISNLDTNLDNVTSTVQIDAIKFEMAILEKYVPAQLTEQKLLEIVSALNPSNMGEAMGHLKTNYSGQYDGKVASQVVKGYLS